MNISNGKTILLIVLIIGVVVQTGKLWFEESSGHNFFSILPSSGAKVSNERFKIEPERIMVNLGNTRFVKIPASSSDITTIADNHISEAISNGKYVDTTALNWVQLLERKSIVYEYPLRLSAEALARSYGISAGEFRNRVTGFEALVIRPARNSSENMRVYAVDSLSERVHCFETLRGVSEPLSREIDSLRQTNELMDGEISYISSIQNSLDFFEGHVYLPEWRTPFYAYPKVYITNPIEDSGTFENNVQLFFDNPVGLLSGVDPAGVPFVSDKDAVVKYFDSDELLEYTSYKTQRPAEAGFDASYTAARSFMKRDLTLQNEVYMTGAEFENNEWKLFFDYQWDGLRVFVPWGSAIEITVSGGAVAKYRRIVKKLDRSELYGQLDESFIAALDRFLLKTGVRRLDGMELGFDANENGFSELLWFFERDGEWSAD